MDEEQLQQIYSGGEYYWGKESSNLAKMIWNYIRFNQKDRLKAVDLGSGEGRDSVYLAELGFDVLAVDISPAGLGKARKLAAERNVHIRTLQGDLNSVILPEVVDVMYSIGSLQYIEPENRKRQFKHFRDQTRAGGLHVLFAFVDHPDVEVAPDWGKNEHFYKRDELLNYYEDWETLHTEEYIFDCNSSGIPHRHAAQVLIARKPMHDLK